MKKRYLPLLTSTILVLTQWLSHPAWATELPTPPDRGTPSGNPTPGGTRPESLCQSTEQPLTALIANKGKDFTHSSHPTFWFYVPYAPENIRYIEFAIKDAVAQKTIYRTAVKVLKSPGLIKISVPQADKYALAAEKKYHWDLLLYCAANQSDEPDLRLDGWVQRIPITEPLTTTQDYVNKEVWYDAIAHAAEQHFANPNNQQLNETWLNLLQFLGQESLISAKIADAEFTPTQE